MKRMQSNEKVLYKNGWITVSRLTEAEVDEYLKLKPGIYVTADKIRQVEVADGEMRILEQMADGLNRIKLKICGREAEQEVNA